MLTERRKKPIDVRFWAHVEIKSPNECWLWTASTRKGYGRFMLTRTHPVAAHRLAYMLLMGPIVPEQTLDHMCHQPSECLGGNDCLHRRCCNPRHLRISTIADNLASHRTSHKGWTTHCEAGHEYNEVNTYYYHRPDGRIKRQCRICRRTRRKNGSS